MKRLLLAATIALLALPALAHASTCQRVSSALAIHMDAGTDVVKLYRNGDAIYNVSSPCAGATVYNTSSIFISDGTPNKDGTDYVGIDLSGGPFAPGTGSSAGGNVPEIKIHMYLGQGDNVVLVSGTDGSDTIRGGVTIDHNYHYLQGLNLNAGAEEQPGKVADPDLVWEYGYPENPPEHETFQIDGGSGDDTINLSGGPGFDRPIARAVTMYGSGGNDHLTGGDGGDTFYADAGDDVLDGWVGSDWVNFETAQSGVHADFANPNPQDTRALGKDQFKSLEIVTGSPYDDAFAGGPVTGSFFGMGGNDVFVGRAGPGSFEGGPGNDTVSYERATSGVTIDLGTGYPQKTAFGDQYLTDIENLVGSPYADELTGDAGPNTIDGLGGADALSGKAARDELRIRDGKVDQATCGTGTDQVVADTQGTDAIFGDCELIDFAPAPPQPTPTPGSGSPGSGNPTPSPAGDRVAPVLSGLRLKQKKISYKLSEPATVKLRVQRKVGRRWKTLRGALSQKGIAGLNKKRFVRRLGRGSYRLAAVATDGAGNRSKKRLVRFSVGR